MKRIALPIGALLLLIGALAIYLSAPLQTSVSRTNSTPNAGVAAPLKEVAAAPAPSTIRASEQEKEVSGTVAQQTEAPANPRQEVANQLSKRIGEVLALSEENHESVFTNLLPALVACDPVEAAHLADRIEAGLDRSQFLDGLASAWGALDPSQATVWAERLSDPGEREAALATIRSLNAPAEGEEPPVNRRDAMLARAAFVVAQTDPAIAASIMTQMPEGPAKVEAGLSVFHQWAIQNTSAASEWLEHLPQGLLRERCHAELMSLAQYRQIDSIHK